ncbi:Lipopolysaccharide assembly protein B [termite gut metagenome]|uniref:Lipopolysaccharide assembly protein B n=1 Tax=termite gut metagenome TaxID=433724 RepID=A0A5J4SWK9_9ZZZZ
MKKYGFLLIVCCLFAVRGEAQQAPKWMEKAKHAVFSVITYDKDDKILNTGNGFFVSENGVALSDYSLFKGASRAIIIDAEGKQMPVDAILGANDMYDVIKLRVKITKKKVLALPIANIPPAVGADVYLLPYSTQKDRSFTTGKVKEVGKIGDNHQYYTLSMQLKDKMVSCPLTTADGMVIGLAQKSLGKDTVSVCYATGASFALSLTINALFSSDLVFRNIGIRKGLPDTEEQALVAMYIASSQLTREEYADMLDYFVEQYPNSVDGYIRRATHYVDAATDDTDMEKADRDIDQALKIAAKKDEVYYDRAKLIYGYQLGKPENTYKDWTYSRSLTEIHKALAIDSLPVYIQTEGDIYFAQQDYATAFMSYQKVTRTDLASPDIFFRAAKAKELAQGDINEVIALLDSCMARCPQPMNEQNASYLLERAQLKMNAEQYHSAMLDYDAYHHAVKGSVNDVFYYYREQAALKAKQFQRALDDIKKAIELNPKDVNYHTELGVVNFRVGRYEEAIKSFSEALAIDPRYAESYRLRGLCRLQMKQNKEACAEFAKAKELGDTAVEALIEKHCK